MRGLKILFRVELLKELFRVTLYLHNERTENI